MGTWDVPTVQKLLVILIQTKYNLNGLIQILKKVISKEILLGKKYKWNTVPMIFIDG
jgi:hypothetical protein